MSNVLSSMYNAAGHTLTYGGGGKSLATGIAAFRFHFRPMSIALARTAFGARSTYQAICDRGLNVRAGDMLVVTSIGSGLVSGRRFRVDGVADYYHHFNFLDHLILALSEFSEA